MNVAIVWFRRNLRLDDNAAITEALRTAGAVIPVFVLDDSLFEEDFSPPRLAVLRDALEDLSAELEKKGSRLVLRNGPPARVLASLVREVGADVVVAPRDPEPHAKEREALAASALSAIGARLVLVEDLHTVESASLRTAAGRPYSVFTPFFRSWLAVPKPGPLPEPGRIPTPQAFRNRPFPSIALSKVPALRHAGAAANPRGGAREARRLWNVFRDGALRRYTTDRDRPDLAGTSRLSPHLRLGAIGPRRLHAEAREAWRGAPPEGRRSIETFVKELGWREFYAAVLDAFPDSPNRSLRPEMDLFPWVRGEEAERAFGVWSAGRTGFPIVDAGMRQLLHEGWMHNRVRMVVASFLTKDLRVDWRRGEAFFRRHLADGDLASNVGGWQWAAGAGTDAQPFFRVFNPVLQGKRFDPEGAYVRRWVPELQRWKGPASLVHEPWRAEAPPAGYPPPFVDHAAARDAALAAFASIPRSP